MDLTRKTTFFEGCSWFKFSNLGLTPAWNFTIYILNKVWTVVGLSKVIYLFYFFIFLTNFFFAYVISIQLAGKLQSIVISSHFTTISLLHRLLLTLICKSLVDVYMTWYLQLFALQWLLWNYWKSSKTQILIFPACQLDSFNRHIEAYHLHWIRFSYEQKNVAHTYIYLYILYIYIYIYIFTISFWRLIFVVRE